MKKSTETICIVLIVCILSAISIGVLICILVSDNPTIKDRISQAELEQLEEQEQFKELQGIKEKLDSSLVPRPSIPSVTIPEQTTAPDSVILVPDYDTSFNSTYERIISTLKYRAEACELQVGDSVRPESAENLSGDQPDVYSSDEAVVTVSEDYTITAVAPGETYVLFYDGETFLVYACVVTE